jgi:hypothetical protein
MSLKLIDPSTLKDVVRVDKDTVTFTLVSDDSSIVVVKVHRYMKGWTPYISVTIDNVSYHDADVEPGDMVFFDELMNRALTFKDLNFNTHRKTMFDLLKTTVSYTETGFHL